MSQFPFQLDSDADLPRVDDNITEIGGLAINALRSAMFNVEAEIGIGASGTAGSIAQRLNVSLQPDGSINPSILVGLINNIGGLVDEQISPTAAIQESKLRLTYSTASLFTLYTTLKNSVDILNGFLSLTGVKVEPHIDGTNYNHLLSAIHIDPVPGFVKTNPGALPGPGTNVINRDTTNLDTLLQDINTDLVVHEKSDSSAGVTATTGGTVPPENFAHVADGIYVDPASFITIPQSNDNVQKVIDFIDNSSLLLLGSRVQNFYENGIANTSRSSSLLADGYGEPLVPPTPVTTFFLNVPPGPPATSPVDDFSHGDDVVLFNPTSTQLNTFNFDAAFAQINPGDLITVDYGTGVFFQFAVDSVKSLVSNDGSVRTYAVRINGKNPVADGYAFARIDRALFHRNKFGVLATCRAPNQTTSYESLIVTNPRSAIALGNGFNASKFDSTHYNLYLSLLSNGDLSNIFNLPAIDVTGNQGATPGAYTLDSIVDNINTAFREPGFNYRFTAFEYQGQIGIALDPFNNAAFSIISGNVDGYGNYTSTSNVSFPNNVVDGYNLIDPLGFGPLGANVASPPPAVTYGSTFSAMFAPTLLFYPLKRNFFYANGVERDQLKTDPLVINNIEDSNGDGYWPATITQITTFPHRVEVVYKVNLDLSQSGLAAGKTIVIQPLSPNTSIINNINYGRFIVSNVSFTNCPGPTGFTNITVYDAVHGAGVSPRPIFATGTPVNMYFSDDSVTFSQENVFDGNSTNYPYKRFFEIYVDGNGHTTSHERARFSLVTTAANIATINMVNVSPKLRGYTTNGNDKEIRLFISDYDFTTGLYFAQLGRWNPSLLTFTHLGPVAIGKKGTVTRIYDETNIDFIDFVFDSNVVTLGFTNQTVDIQLFKTLELDQQFMLLATCQVNDSLKSISHLSDERQFGNISEEQLSTSAKDFISATDKETRENGIIRGFDFVSQGTNTISFTGGEALVNGKLVQINPQSITIPAILESLPTTPGGGPSLTSTVNTIIWFVCANDKGEIELVASTDYDPIGPFITQYLAAGVNHLRLFYGLNLNAASPTPYLIRSSFLSDLVLNQRDLAVFATVSATATLSGGVYSVSSLLYVDAKRYVTVGNGGLSEPFTLGANASFRSLLPLNNWLVQLNELVSAGSPQANAISNKVIVKGHVNIPDPEFPGFPVELGFANNTVYFEGDGNGVFDVYTPTGIVITGNVHFNNVTFNYFYDPTVVYDPNAYTALSGTFNVSNGNNLVSTSTSQVGVLTQGSVITFGSQVGTLYTVASVSAGSITLTVNYTGVSNPSTGSFSGYSTSNLINSGKGLIYVNVSTTNRNIAVTNCKFIWNPIVANTFPLFTTTTSAAINRHSFINIEIAQPTVTGATIIQDVNISKNTFIDMTLPTFSPAAQETIRAAVAFVSTSTVATAGINLKMIDVVIRDNICDKDQMIAIAPSYSVTANTIFNTINTTGVLIENNTCGSIAVFTQYYAPYETLNTFTFNFLDFTLDKNNGIIIRGNTCKYIHSVDSTGMDLSNPAATSLGSGLTTGPMIVADNIVSWIKLPLNTIFVGGQPCVIKHNTMKAYDSNFLKLFTTTPSSVINAAIKIDYIGTPASPSPVCTATIDGNTIDAGIYATVSPPLTTYNYDIGIYSLYHDINAVNNFIANLNTAAVGIWVESIGGGITVHSTINNNKFYRFLTDWLNYIFLGTGGTHTVTDNFFDQPNPSGIYPANFENIIGGSAVNVSSIYGNVNQVVSEAFSLADNLLAVRSANSSIEAGQDTNGPAKDASIFFNDGSNFRISRYTNYFNSVTGTIGSSSMYVSSFESIQATAGTRTMSFTIPLSNRLPPGVKILSMTLGAWLQLTSGATLNIGTAQNVLSLTLNVYQNNPTGALGSFGVADVKNNIIASSVDPATNTPPGTDNSVRLVNGSSLLVGSAPATGTNSLGPYTTVTQAAITGATQYLTLVPSIEITTGNNYRLAVQFDVNYTAHSTPTNSVVNWYFSPLIVIYAWGATTPSPWSF